MNKVFLEMTSQHQSHVQIFTDGSKVYLKVAAAAVSSVAPNSPFSCWLRDHHSIYAAELQAIPFALKQACQYQKNKFMIFSDPWSALQAVEKLKTGHPLLIQGMLQKRDADQKEVVFMWVPGHVGICGMMLLIELLKKLSKRNLQLTPCSFQT